MAGYRICRSRRRRCCPAAGCTPATRATSMTSAICSSRLTAGQFPAVSSCCWSSISMRLAADCSSSPDAMAATRIRSRPSWRCSPVSGWTSRAVAVPICSRMAKGTHPVGDRLVKIPGRLAQAAQGGVADGDARLVADALADFQGAAVAISSRQTNRNHAGALPRIPCRAGGRQQPLRADLPVRGRDPLDDQVMHIVVVVASDRACPVRCRRRCVAPRPASPFCASCRISARHPDNCPPLGRRPRCPSVPSCSSIEAPVR